MAGRRSYYYRLWNAIQWCLNWIHGLLYLRRPVIYMDGEARGIIKARGRRVPWRPRFDPTETPGAQPCNAMRQGKLCTALAKALMAVLMHSLRKWGW
jgi:hypothetical protein